jgi:hypothetical protein
MLISAMLVIVAIIHLLPLSGLLGAEKLNALYGTSIGDPDLEILMRHRAVLFGLLGVFILVAAFRPELQVMALVAGFVSVLSFLWLASSVGDYNSQIVRVVLADGVAMVCLIVAAAARIYLAVAR